MYKLIYLQQLNSDLQSGLWDPFLLLVLVCLSLPVKDQNKEISHKNKSALYIYWLNRINELPLFQFVQLFHWGLVAPDKPVKNSGHLE